jgi:hypothetical protein
MLQAIQKSNRFKEEYTKYKEAITDVAITTKNSIQSFKDIFT